MAAKLYWFSLSHPAHAARRMLERKGVEYELATVLPGSQRVHLRLAGFRGGTVPALKLDGRRVQGTMNIARALEALRPEPPLLPADPRAEEAERWADEELQMVPRRILRWGLTRHASLRTWISELSGVPLPDVSGALGVPAAHYYARAVGADEPAVRRALDELPATLARVDALLAEGVLTPEAPTAATLQVLCCVRALDGFADLHDRVSPHPCAAPARELYPDYPDVPAFL